MKLYNDKIRLIAFEGEHWPFVYSWANSGLYDYFFGNILPLTKDASVGFNSNGINFMIVDYNDVNKIYGMISLHDFNERSRNFVYSILVDKAVQRKGIAKEASKFALYYAFNNLNLYKCIATVNEGNESSKALTEGFGFKFEACLKHEIYIDGDFKDVNRYMMTKGSFNKKYMQELEGVNL